MEKLQHAWQWLLERWHVEDVILADSEMSWLVLVIAVAMLALVWNDRVWDKVQFANTLIHEIGHSIVALFTGRRLHGLRVFSDSSGVAVSSGKQHGLGMLLTVLAGYPAPGLLAALMAWLLSIGYAGAALTIYHVLLLFGFLLVRNLVALVTVMFTAAATLGITIWGTPEMVSFAVIALIVFYAVGGVRGALSLVKVHAQSWGAAKHGRKHQKEVQENVKTSDASQAARLSFYILPTWFWIFGFLLVNVAALAYSMWALVF